jgi:opacity protein-like surface antigen
MPFSRRLLLLAVSGWMAVSGLRAADPPQPSYEPRYPWDTPLTGIATLGGVIAVDRDVREYPLSSPGDQLELAPGFAVTLGTGGQLQRWLRLELETGVIGNELHRIGNDHPDGYLAHFPVFLNTLFLYDSPKTRWVPYAGVGLGGVFSLLNIESPIGLEGTFTDVTYAAQALAGVRYKLNRQLSVGVAYRYFHTGSLSFEDDDSPASRMRFDEGGAHALSIIFMLRR